MAWVITFPTKALCQRTALAGLTWNRLAASQREVPASIAITTRSRRSADRAKGIRLSSRESRVSNHIYAALETTNDSSRWDTALASAFAQLLPGDLASWFWRRSTSSPLYTFNSAAERYIVRYFFGSADDALDQVAVNAALANRSHFDDARLLLRCQHRPSRRGTGPGQGEHARIALLLGLRLGGEPPL